MISIRINPITVRLGFGITKTMIGIACYTDEKLSSKIPTLNKKQKPNSKKVKY